MNMLAALALILASYTPPIQANTVSALPACSTATRGLSYIVTDALTPVALSTAVGGGAVVVRVTCNGTAWTVM